MSDVLIRNVSTDDLERIRAEAAAQGVSLQSYLLETVRAQAAYLRRHEALTRTADRLQGQSAVTEHERQAVLEAVETAHGARGAELAGGDR